MTDTVTERLRPLRLKRREGKRIRAGHLWVFSNEIDTDSTPLRLFEPGDLVSIRGADGRFIANGYVNPHSLIAARVLNRDQKRPPDRKLLFARVRQALALREKLYPEPFYRVVFGEADLLPGLVVDRYNDVLVVQLTTAGMERLKDDVLAVLHELLNPVAVLWKNDTGVRKLEGLENYVEPAWGEVPDIVEVREGRARFDVPLAGGQKTGWFYDQRANRELLRPYVNGARVLDVYSYVGGFGIQCRKHGAEAVTCVDSSERALEFVRSNAKKNRFKVETIRGNAHEVLRDLHREKTRFDTVILDPPAFVKKKRDLDAGRTAYAGIIRAGMQLLERDGFLLACSCSSHMPEAELIRLVQRAAKQTGRHAQLLAVGGQAPDHPVHPAIPETRYLKSLLCRVSGQR